MNKLIVVAAGLTTKALATAVAVSAMAALWTRLFASVTRLCAFATRRGAGAAEAFLDMTQKSFVKMTWGVWYNFGKPFERNTQMKKLLMMIAAAAVVACATFPMSANAGTYYKLGSDANTYTSFSGTYTGGGSTIGWASSRDATTTVTPTDMANSDFVIVDGTELRTSRIKGDYTFPGRTLVFEAGGTMNVKAGEFGGGDSTFAIPMIVGAGGKITLNAGAHTHTFTGGMSINSSSSLILRFNGTSMNGIFNSTFTGDNTTTLYLDVAAANALPTLELSDAAGFLGTIADGGTGAANEKLILKLTGGFGGTITSLPTGTTKVLVNYDGLPSGTGLRIATTIPAAIMSTVTFYSMKNVFMDGDVLMTFPAGTVVDPSAFTVNYAYGADETATAFSGLQKIDNQDGTVSLAVKSKTYYKLGSDADGKTSFGGTYTGGGTTIGWTDSRTGKEVVTPTDDTDMANSDFVIGSNTTLRSLKTNGNYAFKGKTLVIEDNGQFNVKAGESGGGDSTFAIPMIVGDGGTIALNGGAHTYTFTGGVCIKPRSSLTLWFTKNDGRSGIFNSVFMGDDMTTLYLQSATNGSTAPTFEFSNAADFLGTIADGGTGAASEKLVLKLTGGFGGTITSLPAGTQQLLVNYDGLPERKGLRVASTTIPEPLKTVVTFYSSTAAFLSDGFVLMTFPSGTVVDPSAFTVKYAGSASETARTFAHLKKIDNADGTVSLAVFNDGDFPTAGDVIDLAGASRDIPSDWVRFCAGFTVTDTVGGGELHVNVGSGVTVTNTRISFAGKLKFVKDGEGTFISAIEQTYTGGNLIAAGVAMPPKGGGTSTDYMPSNGWKGFGNHAAQNADAAVIRVNTNAVFDINGVYGFCKHKIILNGGTLRNSVAQSYYEHAQAGVAIHSLEADSTLEVLENTRYWDGTATNDNPCDLGTHTLTLSIATGKTLGVSSSFTNGVIEYAAGGNFKPLYANGNPPTPAQVELQTVHFVQKAALNITTDTNVGDYTCEYTGSSTGGALPFNVYGTFTPTSQKFCNVVMQNGSAIDLSGKDAAFSTAGALSGKTVSFASCEGETTVTILTGDRALTSGEKLIGWASGAEPDSTVKFVPQPSLADKWRFNVLDDGVYAMKKKGLVFIVK